MHARKYARSPCSFWEENISHRTIFKHPLRRFSKYVARCVQWVPFTGKQSASVFFDYHKRTDVPRRENSTVPSMNCALTSMQSSLASRKTADMKICFNKRPPRSFSWNKWSSWEAGGVRCFALVIFWFLYSFLTRGFFRHQLIGIFTHLQQHLTKSLLSVHNLF